MPSYVLYIYHLSEFKLSASGQRKKLHGIVCLSVEIFSLNTFGNNSGILLPSIVLGSKGPGSIHSLHLP